LSTCKQSAKVNGTKGNTSSRVEETAAWTNSGYQKKDHVLNRIHYRKRSMNFDDSFFDEDANDKKGKSKILCEEYNPKVCEPKVTAYFSTVKHRAL